MSKINPNSFNRYEHLMEEFPLNAGKNMQKISRDLRLGCAYEEEHDKVLWDTSVDIIGPTFFLFIWWVLEEAEKKGVETLYFLARDGQVLLEIAKIIKEKMNYKVECRYLYASREAWYLPSMENKFCEFELDWIMVPLFCFLSVDMVFKRLKIDPEKVKDLLEKNGLPKKTWNHRLDAEEIKILTEILKEKEVSDLIEEASKPYFKNAIGYLEQEKVFSGKACGIVDIGWRARLLFALSKLMNKNGTRPEAGIKGFYFGLDVERRIYPGDDLSSFLFDLEKEPGNMELYIPALYEIFAASDHGRTVGFEKKENEYAPVFDEDDGTREKEWGVSVQQEGIIAFAKAFAGTCRKDELELGSASSFIKKILKLFIDSPTSLEAEAYGKFVISAGQLEDVSQEIAPELTYKTLFKKAEWKKRKSVWPQGSFSRSNMPILNWIWKRFIR